MSEIVVIIRPSFKKVCGPDACRAALYNHILYRLARKAKTEPDEKVKNGEVFWYASAEDICTDIDEAWCVNKVRKEVKALTASGLLGQRHNPIRKWDRRYQYFMSEVEGKALLEKAASEGVCLLHVGLKAEVLHLLHMVNAFDKNGGCICQKEEIDLPDMVVPFTTNGRAITEGSTEGSSTEGSTEETDEEGTCAVAQSTREEHLALKEKIRDTDYRLKAIAKGHGTDAVPAHGPGTALPARSAGVSPVDVAAQTAVSGAATGVAAPGAAPAAAQTPEAGRAVELPAKGTSAAAVATQKRLSLKDETPRPSAKRQMDDEIAHYYDILQAELPGVVFSASQRKARNNIATIQAMISDKLPDETLRKALKKLSAWERQNFNLKRFYEEWMPAKLASEPVRAASRRCNFDKEFAEEEQQSALKATGTDDLAAYGTTEFDIYKGNGPEERRALALLADTVPDSYWEV